MKILFRKKQKPQNILEGAIKKTNNEVLEEAIQSIETSKQLLNEDWSSRWLPRWLGGGSNETPDWLPNILGKGTGWGSEGGISLKDAGPMQITPEMMETIIANNPDIDMSTREGWEAAMKMGGMTGEQAKAETEEYFDTGVGGLVTAAALATLYAAAPAAPAAAAAEAGAAGAGTTAAAGAAEVGAVGAGKVAAGTGLRVGASSALSPATRASMLARTMATRGATNAASVGQKAGLLTRGAGWLKSLYANHWGKIMIASVATEQLAPKFYDTYLKYVDPGHYAWQVLRILKLAPYLGDEHPPIWFGGPDPGNLDPALGLDKYMPWYEESIEEDNVLVAELASASEAMNIANEQGDATAFQKADERRRATVEKMKEHSAADYNHWIETSKSVNADLTDGTFGEAPEAAETETLLTHGPENPAVYAYGTEAEKAYYEELKEKLWGEGAEEFLNIFIYGGEE
jgi:hypothetical protein